MTPKNSAIPSASKPAIETTTAEDKYAALKDLDDLFKNTVVMNDGKSTGTSLFGSSPMAPAGPLASAATSSSGPPPAPSQPSATTSVFGPSPTNGGGVDFAANWGNIGGGQQEPTRVDRGPSPNAGWAANWPSASSTSTNNGSAAKAPINPFTGTLRPIYYVFTYCFVRFIFPDDVLCDSWKCNNADINMFAFFYVKSIFFVVLF